MNNQVTAYIDDAPLAHKEILQTLRCLIHKYVENVTEQVKWSRPVFRTTKDIAYFKTQKYYVTLGFFRDYKKLNDPNKILEGTGNTMRHLKIKSAADLDIKLLTQWFISLAAE